MQLFCALSMQDRDNDIENTPALDSRVVTDKMLEIVQRRGNFWWRRSTYSSFKLLSTKKRENSGYFVDQISIRLSSQSVRIAQLSSQLRHGLLPTDLHHRLRGGIIERHGAGLKGLRGGRNTNLSATR